MVNNFGSGWNPINNFSQYYWQATKSYSGGAIPADLFVANAQSIVADTPMVLNTKGGVKMPCPRSLNILLNGDADITFTITGTLGDQVISEELLAIAGEANNSENFYEVIESIVPDVSTAAGVQCGVDLGLYGMTPLFLNNLDWAQVINWSITPSVGSDAPNAPALSITFQMGQDEFVMSAMKITNGKVTYPTCWQTPILNATTNAAYGSTINNGTVVVGRYCFLNVVEGTTPGVSFQASLMQPLKVYG